MKNNKVLVFATSNKNKINEINKILPKNINLEIKSKADIGILEDIPETGMTIEENAIIKAKYIFEKYGFDCFAEDTGLIVESLNGEPGIYSARYAGEERDDTKNMQKILTKLNIHENRKAKFYTVIALILGGELHLFEGEINGIIIHSPRGDSGFGYDPIFLPNGYDKTFAELGIDIKNKISHRSIAINKLIDFFKKEKI